MMVYGIISLGSYFAWRPPRGIPELRFMVLGLCFPTSAWALTYLFEPFCLLTPLSLGCLWWWTETGEIKMSGMMRTEKTKLLREADASIARDPGDAVAFFTKAEIFEKAKDFKSALENYEQAHRISPLTISPREMKEIRERLQEGPSRPVSSPDWIGKVMAFTVLEKIFVVCGILLLFNTWSMGVNVMSVMLFLLWCKKEPCR